MLRIIGGKKIFPTRMRAVKDVFSSIYPIQLMEKKETVWKVYRVPIDSVRLVMVHSIIQASKISTT